MPETTTSAETTPPRPSWRPTVIGTHHAVACGHYLAAAAAMRILDRGGNAVDAGVTAAMALAIVQPDIVSFAGVAPTLVYLRRENRVVSLAGLGYWPAATDAKRLAREGSGVVPDGILRTVMPAAPATHIEALRRYGTISFEEAATPAYLLARDGFAAYPVFVRHLEKFQDKYLRWTSSTAVYLPGGRPPAVGAVFRQEELARSIWKMIEAERAGRASREHKLAAAHDCFYRGPIAEAIEEYHVKHGGFVRKSDLAGFTAPVEESIRCSYKGIEVHGCDVWCQGIVLLEALKILEGVNLRALGHNTPGYIHTVAEALNLAFADREAYVGDPKFVKVPTAGLLSDEYAARQRSRIDPNRASGKMPEPGRPAGAPQPFVSRNLKPALATAEAGPDTIYCAVVDGEGNAYSATLSDNARDTPVIPGYGGTVSSRGTQSRLEPGHPSEVQPGKRPRLTPTPALALRDGRLYMAFGTPGGDVQTQAMLQVFLNVVEFGMTMQQAIEAPRFGTFGFPNSFAPHTYLPGRLNLESRFPQATIEAMRGLGHDVEVWPELAPAAGAVCAVLQHPGTGLRHAGADPRREAYAIAW